MDGHWGGTGWPGSSVASPPPPSSSTYISSSYFQPQPLAGLTAARGRRWGNAAASAAPPLCPAPGDCPREAALPYPDPKVSHSGRFFAPHCYQALLSHCPPAPTAPYRHGCAIPVPEDKQLGGFPFTVHFAFIPGLLLLREEQALPVVQHPGLWAAIWAQAAIHTSASVLAGVMAMGCCWGSYRVPGIWTVPGDIGSTYSPSLEWTVWDPDSARSRGGRAEEGWKVWGSQAMMLGFPLTVMHSPTPHRAWAQCCQMEEGLSCPNQRPWGCPASHPAPLPAGYL